MEKIAADADEFNSHFSQALNLLSDLGEEEFVNVMKGMKVDSTAAKFHGYKMCLNQIYRNWIENPDRFGERQEEQPTPLTLALNLAKGREANEQRVVSFLDNLYKSKNSNELKKQLYSIFQSHYKGVCGKWVKDKISQPSSQKDDCTLVIEKFMERFALA